MPAQAPFRIQYASRLFINAATCLKQKLTPAPNTKYLVLAGNCVAADHHTTEPFFSYLSANWEKTFLVPGTLEHADLSGNRHCWQHQAETLRKKAMKYKNVFICEQSIYRLPEFTLIATPLGGAYLGNPTELIAADPPLKNLYASNGNIFTKMRFINEEDTDFIHEALKLERDTEKPIVMASYQLPVIHLIGQKKEEELCDGKANPMSLTGNVSFLPPKLQNIVFSNSTPLKAWIAGASDASVNMSGLNGQQTIFTTNSATSRGYDPRWFVELA
jgi:hypothetical protein